MALKLEFLEQGSTDCPLIRFFGDHTEAWKQLHSQCEQLASGAVRESKLHELAGIEAIGNCSLIAVASARDRGADHSGEDFRWELTPSGWDNVAGLLEPFAQGVSRGFQWLDAAGEIRVLASRDDRW